jgi:hypothetical protein
VAAFEDLIVGEKAENRTGRKGGGQLCNSSREGERMGYLNDRLPSDTTANESPAFVWLDGPSSIEPEDGLGRLPVSEAKDGTSGGDVEEGSRRY